MNRQFPQLLGWLMLTLLPLFANSTTIIPFKNLGALTERSDAVVVARVTSFFEVHNNEDVYYRYRLRVIDPIKGDLAIGQSYEIQKWEMKSGEAIRKIFGDIELAEGNTYLMFLSQLQDNRYHPLCFSYYLFKEHEVGGKSYLAPASPEGEFILVDDQQSEPLYIFKKGALIDHLKGIAHGSETWSSNGLLAETDVTDRLADHTRAAPSHCNYLSSGSSFRWTDFPDEPLHVYYHASGDGVCGSIPEYVGTAINELKQSYTGINLINGGSDGGFSPTCGSAYGSSYRNYIMNTFGDSRRVMIQFNDPCGEMPALQNCGGTLAVGGLFGIGTHTYKGEQWYSGAYGYVVINDGVGNCFCNAQDYRDLIVHELSHSLGLGHISSSNGMANMNPVCCNSVQVLDWECMDFSYEGGIFLPVELQDFSGEEMVTGNKIHWTTASEQDLASFTVERALDEEFSSFEALQVITAKGQSSTIQQYNYMDVEPRSTSLYRLRMQDYDGTTTYSEIIVIQREDKERITLYPTMINNEFYVDINDQEGGLARLEIADLTGKVILREFLDKDLNRVTVRRVTSGTYIVRVMTEDLDQTFRIIKL